MGKQINVYFDEKNRRLVITEDNVQNGDYIDLDSLSNFESFIKQQAFDQYKQQIINSSNELKELNETNQKLKDTINNNKQEIQNLVNKNNNLLEQQKVELENAKLKAISDFKQQDADYLNLIKNNQNLKQSNIELEANLKSKVQEIESVKTNAINEFKSSGEYTNLQRQINDLNLQKQQLQMQLSNSKTEFQQSLEIAKAQAIQEFRNSSEFKELSDAKTKLSASESNKELALKQQEIQFNDRESKLKTSYQYQIDELNKKIEDITLARSSSNTKLLGERLEVECWDNYNNSMGQFVNDSIFKRATKEINGRKPDFIFDVYAHSLYDESIKENPKLISAVLEMKTESLLSQDANKKKNKDHLEKLEKDRINNNADFAILVTELESNDEFIIKRDPGFPKIIIVRPMAMVPVLSLIRTIGLKNRDVQLQAIEFKNQQEIIDEFEEFKNSILENSLKNINKNLDEIIRYATTIETTARKIQEEANKALNKHTKTIENKINGFKIENRIIKKINGLETVGSKPSLTSGVHTELDDDAIIKENVKIKN